MKLTIREITVFGMLGALMYASKIIMEVAPNVHLLGVFTIAITVVYRKKALYPIYTYVLLNGMFSGFATWWIPYLYLCQLNRMSTFLKHHYQIKYHLNYNQQCEYILSYQYY